MFVTLLPLHMAVQDGRCDTQIRQLLTAVALSVILLKPAVQELVHALLRSDAVYGTQIRE